MPKEVKIMIEGTSEELITQEHDELEAMDNMNQKWVVNKELILYFVIALQ